MRIINLLSVSLILTAALASAAPVLTIGTPANSLLAAPTPPSPNLGVRFTFDGLTPNTIFNPATFAAQGLTISSPDGLLVLPFSTQSFPDELFDNSANGTADITVTLAKATGQIGIGIADSDPVTVLLQALNASAVGFGPVFSVNVNAGSILNPGNAYYVVSDTTSDIFGLRILQTVGSANNSGLAIDDIQLTTPEPGSWTLLGVGAALLAGLRLRKGLANRGHMRSFLSMSTSAVLIWGMMFNPAPVNAATTTPTTPIQHVVIIFNENISFDHYFGTYPKAQNPPGQPRFTALPNTPAVNGLTPALLTNNPNLNPANGAGASNPFRLNRNQALTADQNHNYGPEQQSFDLGAMDLFPLRTGVGGGTPNLFPPVVSTKGLVMGYYDGNTVTALWNYAQRFAMSDNSYNTQFGPSTPGALNLISGQANGVDQSTSLNGPSTSFEVADGAGGFTIIGDSDPLNDVCSAPTRFQNVMLGKNVGDMLNSANVTWGWFTGGFDLTVTNPNGTTGCSRSSVSPVTGLTVGDYIPHHAPFQYYLSTQNARHTRPSSVQNIGFPDAANHQYDIHDWFDALNAGNLPAVSYLKSPAYQDGHPGNSNPLDEQAFIVNVVNTLQASTFWNSTAVIIAYDDSDGWYDHQMAPIVNASFSNQDFLSGPNACGTSGVTPQLPGPFSNNAPVNGRCGYGVRTPLLVISPWAKANFVDHTLTDQTSVLRFIEDNWGLGKIGGGSFDAIANSLNSMFDFTHATPQNAAPFILSPTTGTVQ